jgi:endonuclease III
MPTTTNKQRVVSQIFSTQGKAKHSEQVQRPVLEQFLYAICREGVTREQADQAYRSLQDRFFDWNEIRVSSVREIADILDLPYADARAQRIIDFLQEVFETTYSFDLETLHKKGLKQAAKQLSRYQAANDYSVAWVVQHSLGGHAIPLDPPSLRVLRRLGLLEEDTNDLEALRASIEHQVPKAKGSLFIDLVSALAADCCQEDEVNPSACPMGNSCQACQEAKAAVTVSVRKSR